MAFMPNLVADPSWPTPCFLAAKQLALPAKWAIRFEGFRLEDLGSRVSSLSFRIWDVGDKSQISKIGFQAWS